MTTGQKIKSYRKALGLTQEELGRSIGVGKAAINKYETGIVVNLKRSTLSALAVSLHVTLSDLLDDAPPRESDPNEELLIESYRSLSSRGQELLIERANELRFLYGKKSEDPSAKSV